MEASAPAATPMDDGIVAAAEACLASVGRAREAIHGVIFGQERVVDLALVTILAGGHGLLVGCRGWPRPSSSRRWARCSGSMRGGAVHPRPDALRHPRQRDPRRGPGPAPLVPLRARADLHPAADGRRDQPGEPAHPVGPAAGDAGALRLRRRRAPRPAAPFHVLATQNPIEQEGTYPLPEAQLDRFLLEIDVGYPDRAPSGASCSRPPAPRSTGRSR